MDVRVARQAASLGMGGRVFSEQALQDLRGKEYLHPFSRKGEGRRRSGGAAATKQASLFPRQIKHRPSRFHLTTAPESSGAVVRLFVKQVAPRSFRKRRTSSAQRARISASEAPARIISRTYPTPMSFSNIGVKNLSPSPRLRQASITYFRVRPSARLRRAASGSNRRRGRACLRAADVWLPQSDGA